MLLDAWVRDDSGRYTRLARWLVVADLVLAAFGAGVIFVATQSLLHAAVLALCIVMAFVSGRHMGQMRERIFLLGVLRQEIEEREDQEAFAALKREDCPLRTIYNWGQ